MTSEHVFLAVVERLGGNPTDSDVELYFRAVTGGSWNDFANARKFWQSHKYRVADLPNAKEASMLAGTLGSVTITDSGRQYVKDRNLLADLEKEEKKGGVLSRIKTLIGEKGWQIGGEQGTIDGKGHITFTRISSAAQPIRFEVTEFLDVHGWLDLTSKAHKAQTTSPSAAQSTPTSEQKN